MQALPRGVTPESQDVPVVYPTVALNPTMVQDEFKYGSKTYLERDMGRTTPPPPKPGRVRRLPGGYRIRADLDAALRHYQGQHEGVRRVDIIDHALEEYLGRRGVWPLPEDR